jgi:hypothetical protein
MSEEQRPTATSTNHAVAMGRCYIDRNPLNLLRHLRASICYSPGVGYYIPLGNSQDSYAFKRLLECIAFHEGEEVGNVPTRRTT